MKKYLTPISKDIPRPVKLRDGTKAYIVCISERSYPLRGYRILPNKLIVEESWSQDGIYDVDEDSHLHDIIGEWTEPKKIVQYYSINEDGLLPDIYNKLEEAETEEPDAFGFIEVITCPETKECEVRFIKRSKP